MPNAVLMIIAPEQFRDEELLVPRRILTDAGYTVDTISTRTGTATGMLGASETIETTLTNVDTRHYDAAVVVGGMGSLTHLWDNWELHNILKALAGNGKITAGICLSGAVLGKAGLLKGKKATVWPDETAIQVLKDSGADYTGEPCTVDGNTITANGPEAAQAFGEAILARLKQLTPA
ncbi:MAG: DJ-1/PfpI family protein [Candidatus Melainabacteria bacterium]